MSVRFPRPRLPRVLRLDDPRRRRTRVLILVLVALAVGAFGGQPGPGARAPESATVLDRTVVPLLGELDAVWSGGREGGPSIAEALQVLRLEGVAPADDLLQLWDQTHETLLVRMVGIDLPAEARVVQRQAVLVVALSRDAVEAFTRAAMVGPGSARDEQLAQATRLRLRAEEAALAVAASVEDLRGDRPRLVVPSRLPTFDELLGR